MKYAVVAFSGSQYLIKEKDVITVDKLNLDEGVNGTIDEVLLVVNDDEVLVGTPHLTDTKVEFKVVKNYQGKKLRIFKYKAKSRYRLTQGFRPQLCDIEILSIGNGKSANTKVKAEKEVKETKETKVTKKVVVKKPAVKKTAKVTKAATK